MTSAQWFINRFWTKPWKYSSSCLQWFHSVAGASFVNSLSYEWSLKIDVKSRTLTTTLTDFFLENISFRVWRMTPKCAHAHWLIKIIMIIYSNVIYVIPFLGYNGEIPQVNFPEKKIFLKKRFIVPDAWSILGCVKFVVFWVNLAKCKKIIIFVHRLAANEGWAVGSGHFYWSARGSWKTSEEREREVNSNSQKNHLLSGFRSSTRRQ